MLIRAPRLRQRLCDAVVEQTAIGQAGQCVVIRLVHHAFRVRPSFRNVVGDAIDPDRRAVRFMDDAGPVFQPAFASVRPHDSILERQ